MSEEISKVLEKILTERDKVLNERLDKIEAHIQDLRQKIAVLEIIHDSEIKALFGTLDKSYGPKKNNRTVV